MIKNRTTQLIYQTAFCTIGIIGIIASFGFFDYTFRWDFFVHFTNLSNYLCIGIMIAQFVQTLKRKNDDFVKTTPTLKFIAVLCIMLTFLVFNIMLAPAKDRLPELNFKINSITFHIILPIMFVLDWFLFYERKKVKWFAPLISILAPLVYVVFVYIRAAILGFNPDAPFIYPYFFLNISTQGIGGVLKWVAILLVGFVALGYVFYGLDKICKKTENVKENKKDIEI